MSHHGQEEYLEANMSSCQDALFTKDKEAPHSSQLCRDKTDEYDDNRSVSHVQVICKICSKGVGVGIWNYCLEHRCMGESYPDGNWHTITSQTSTIFPEHLLGSNSSCSRCKKHTEQKQISSEALKGGFKAADNKATFDLLPVPEFEQLLNANIFFNGKNKEYLPITTLLLDFWQKDDLLSLNASLLEAFELLKVETGGDVEALFAIGELYAIGAKKYSKRNWEKGIDWGVVWSAAMRHLLNHIRGEKYDPVDGQLHLTSVCWNIIALLHYTAYPKYKEFDSRQEIVVAENKGQK